LQVTTSPTEATFSQSIVLFEVFAYNDGTNRVVVREDHPYAFPTRASRFIHNNVGPVFSGAGGIVAGATDMQVAISGTVVLEDHGIEVTLPDTSTAGVTFDVIYVSGGNYVRYSQTATLPDYWNSAGTATQIAAPKFGVFRLYASKNDLNSATPKYFALMHTAVFDTQNQALAAINNGTIAALTSPITGLEIGQLGYIIVDGNGAGGDTLQVVPLKAVLNASYGAGVAGLGSMAFQNASAVDVTGTLAVAGQVTLSGLTGPGALAIDSDEKVEAVDGYSGNVTSFDGSGTITMAFNRGIFTGLV
jgi:hypothetical protein